MNITTTQSQSACQICYQIKGGLTIPFAKCYHTGVCMRCCEEILKSAINQKQKPKCQYCSASMLEDGEDGEKYAFQYFQTKTQNDWKKYKIQLKNPPCKVPDCHGFIKIGKCLKCCQPYCEKCLEFQHFGKCALKAEQNNSMLFKQCPRCHVKIQKNGGCLKMNCQLCKHKFCYECLEEWESGHHFKHEGGVPMAIAGWFQQHCFCLTRNVKQPKSLK